MVVRNYYANYEKVMKHKKIVQNKITARKALDTNKKALVKESYSASTPASVRHRILELDHAIVHSNSFPVNVIVVDPMGIEPTRAECQVPPLYQGRARKFGKGIRNCDTREDRCI